MTVPTRFAGATDPYAFSSTYAYDALEHVPDLQPGLGAVQVYGQMRRDSRLAAVLAGYTLQIRRASWQIEPGGCRPEVVQQVSDDMGLPVAGQDVAGAARTRGVSWNDHLRSALLCLSYGHMCFELLAEIVDGKARLIALSERSPSTLALIHSDPRSGDFLGVTQDAPRKNNVPQIRAGRLAFYTHDKELSWAGTSLLRSSYAPWYLKQELMRIHAVSARRFGMGVPTVEWAAGTNPTPAQISEAQQLASAARVGEQSGASLPPGASLVLRGLSGSTPDVLGYIKFLNQEMAGAALMPYLDLGNTASGSRATATAFLDSWTLALGAVSEEIADVATRQVAARIVAWNWGDQEQVPRVMVSGVGTQREVTAESLNVLLQSGALSADPGLEAWIRREYRLPERTVAEEGEPPSGRVFEHDLTSGVITKNERRAQIGLPPVEGGDTLVDPATPKLPALPVADTGDTGTPEADIPDDVFAKAPVAEPAGPPAADTGGRLAKVADDKLALGLTRLAQREKWDTLDTVADEMARREEDADTSVQGEPAPHWAVAKDTTTAEWRVDALLAQGADIVAAYRKIYGAADDDQALRRGYDLWAAERELLGEGAESFDRFRAQVKAR